MKERTAFVYECHYCVAEFGEENIVIEAINRQEADRRIDEWCKYNNCVYSESPSGLGPKPRFISQNFLVKRLTSLSDV